MYYTIYKVTNKINGKYYIGMHKTNNLEDGYMGSGRVLKRAIEKYGVENFNKEILFIFDNESDMIRKEKELVVVSENTYNLCPGGKGGFGYINVNGFTNKDKDYQKVSKTMRDKKIKPSANCIFHLSEAHKAGKISYDNFRGKKHKPETLEKMRLVKKDVQSGSNNSQYGTMWITDGEKNKKVSKYSDLPVGWKRGRIVG